MPDLLATALALPGVWWLVGAIVAAGLVRGFTGFGSALIIMPMASSVLDPFAALAFLTVVEFWGPLPNLRAAWRDGTPREAGLLLVGAAVGLPLGLLGLSMLDPEIFGWSVSITVMILLVLVMSGWRCAGSLRPGGVVGIGTMGGFLGGIAGVPGPPVIMFYMASAQAIAVIRANFLLYLLGIDVLMIVLFLGFDLLDPLALTVGLLCAPLYMCANVLGAWLFDPRSERLFRAVAYIVIAAAAIVGLPVWS
ncbi:sulfite exporter TauE/SafE family protein [uncultured Tateyamaria sp.]|uniref:sulfite exporter TauE/SafE family protein n=1 Tax=uncultured Tateyamaria sp. TaxID=455651 RepID=UPI002609126F|nr:sulfite exporter TauE/SafE family protein [uncultured Tateyamaria sp.]